MLEKRSGRMHTKVARFINDQQGFVFVDCFIIEVGGRFGNIAGKVFDAVMLFQNRFGDNFFAIEQNFSVSNTLI